MEVIEIQDISIIGAVNGKILYVEDDPGILAYFYDDIHNIGNDNIRDNVNDIVINLEEVGSVAVDDEWLHDIVVNEGYQQKEIGCNLIKFAIERLGLSKIACVQENNAYTYELTELGEKLIARCIRKGIVPREMCFFEHVPLEEGYINPGQISLVVRSASYAEPPNPPRRELRQMPLEAFWPQSPIFFAPPVSSQNEEDQNKRSRDTNSSSSSQMQSPHS